MLMWRDGPVVALTTMDTSEHGTERIMRIMRRSKLAAISLSRQGVTRLLTAELTALVRPRGLGGTSVCGRIRALKNAVTNEAVTCLDC